MSVFTQDEFDGGMLGSKGMYRNSSLKGKAVKRAINVVPTDEGTLSSRPLTQDVPYEPYALNTRQRVFGGQPPRQYQLPLDQPFLPGTRTLPFTWRGDKYALHYTPYHYLSFVFDRDVKMSSEVPYATMQRTVDTSITDLRGDLTPFYQTGYLRSLEVATLQRASSLYNHLYTQTTPEGPEAVASRNFAMIDWTRSTYLYNVYIVFREDGTVVRQGRPHSIRTLEPPVGEQIPFQANNLAGGGAGHLVPIYDAEVGRFIPGRHELEAALYNRDHMYLGGMTEEDIRRTFTTEINGLLPLWSGSLYERFFTPNVRYEFLDLGDTFTFVDVMGSVEPDITFGRDIQNTHAAYYPVTTLAAGDPALPFPYEEGLEVARARPGELATEAREEPVIDSVPASYPIQHRGPLVMSSFGAEKGDPTPLDVGGTPASPISPRRFAPGTVLFLHGYTSEYTGRGGTLAPPIERYEPLSIEVDFHDTATGELLDGDLFMGLANPDMAGVFFITEGGESHVLETVKVELLRHPRNRIRVSTGGSLDVTAATYRGTVATTSAAPRRVGLVLRRPSPVYVDNAPRLRFPQSSQVFRFDQLADLRSDNIPFFHGAILPGLKGFYAATDSTDTGDNLLGLGFHIIFDQTVEMDYLRTFEKLVFRQTNTIGNRTLRDTFYLNAAVDGMGMKASVYRGVDLVERNTALPESDQLAELAANAYTGSALFRGIQSTDRVLYFSAGTTAPLQGEGATPLPSGFTTELLALAGFIGAQGFRNRKTFRIELFNDEVVEDFPDGRPLWSGFHFDEYAELTVGLQFLTGSSADSPAQISYFPGVTLSRSVLSQYSKRPVLRDEGSDYVLLGTGMRDPDEATEAEQTRIINTIRLRKLSLASLAGGTGYGRDGIYATPEDGGYYTIDVDTYMAQCRFFQRRRRTVTRADGFPRPGLDIPEAVGFRFITSTGTNGNRYAATNTINASSQNIIRKIQRPFTDIVLPYFAYGGLPNYNVYLQDIDSDPDVLAFWFQGLLDNSNIGAVTGAALGYEPAATSERGRLFHTIGYAPEGSAQEDLLVLTARFSFPLRLVDDAVYLSRVGEWNGLSAIPPTQVPVRVMPYYSDTLLARPLTEDTTQEAIERSFAGRICLSDPEAKTLPVPIHLDTSLRPEEAETVLDPNLDDYRPLLDVDQRVPQIWRVYQSRLFWFARRSFGASALLEFGDFDSYKRNTTEGPLALRLAGDNLIPTGQDDTHIHWAYVYEGNLLIGMNTQIRILSRDNPFTGAQIPTTLVRLPSTNITPVYVRNFLFKVRGDLKGIERVVPTFQYGQRIISTTISNPVALDYLDDATIEYMIEHPTDHVFYVGTSDDRILYGHVSPDGIVSWSELIYPDRVGPLQRNSFGVFYRTATNLLRFITGEGVPIETDLTCEIELLPLSLLGRRQTGRLNEGSQQGDASVVVDMPEGEELHLGRGQTIRSRVVYSGGEIRESYRESPEGDEGMLLRYTGSGPFHLIRVAREDNTIIDPRQLFFRQYRPDPRLLGLKEI